MSVDVLNQLVVQTDYMQNYSVMLTIGFGLIIGLLFVLIVKG